MKIEIENCSSCPMAYEDPESGVGHCKLKSHSIKWDWDWCFETAWQKDSVHPDCPIRTSKIKFKIVE